VPKVSAHMQLLLEMKPSARTRAKKPGDEICCHAIAKDRCIIKGHYFSCSAMNEFLSVQ